MTYVDPPFMPGYVSSDVSCNPCSSNVAFVWYKVSRCIPWREKNLLSHFALSLVWHDVTSCLNSWFSWVMGPQEFVSWSLYLRISPSSFFFRNSSWAAAKCICLRFMSLTLILDIFSVFFSKEWVSWGNLNLFELNLVYIWRCVTSVILSKSDCLSRIPPGATQSGTICLPIDSASSCCISRGERRDRNRLYWIWICSAMLDIFPIFQPCDSVSAMAAEISKVHLWSY